MEFGSGFVIKLFFDAHQIYKTEVDLINIFDEIKTMLSHKLYSACVSILIVENPSDLTKLLPSLLEICLRSIDDDEKNFPNHSDLSNQIYARISVK